MKTNPTNKFAQVGNWFTRFIAQCIYDFNVMKNVNVYHRRDHMKLLKEHEQLEAKHLALQAKYDVLYAQSHDKTVADYEALRVQRDVNEKLIAEICHQNATVQKDLAVPDFSNVDSFQQLGNRIRVQNEELMKENQVAIEHVKQVYGLMTEREWRIKHEKEFEIDRSALIKELLKP